jgi:hypothetical protein
MLVVQRTLLTAKVESTYGVDASPSTANDCFLVSNPDFTFVGNVLERNFIRRNFSQLPHVMGLHMAKIKFEHEIRGNGLEQSGIITDAPRLGRLLQGCGFSATAMAADGVIWGPYPIRPSGAASIVTAVGSSSAPTNTESVGYSIIVTTPGVSATAAVTITPDDLALDTVQTGVVVTSGTPFAVGALGAHATLTWAGSLVNGWGWQMSLMKKGTRYDPVSTAQQSLTIKFYLDGILHSLTGCFGTFSMQADAGKYANGTFEFTGFYNPVVDTAFPTDSVYETQLPAMVELGKLTIDKGFQGVVSMFSFDLQNTISQRDDINSANGLKAIRITDRKPKGGIDPEGELVATEDFWGQLVGATQMPLQIRIGTVLGNTVRLLAPNTQYAGITYKTLNDIRHNDIALEFRSGPLGNDEVMFAFM